MCFVFPSTLIYITELGIHSIILPISKLHYYNLSSLFWHMTVTHLSSISLRNTHIFWFNDYTALSHSWGITQLYSIFYMKTVHGTSYK